MGINLYPYLTGEYKSRHPEKILKYHANLNKSFALTGGYMYPTYPIP